MTCLQLDILSLIAEAETKRDAGIQQSMDHADSRAPYNWTDKALDAFIAFLKSKPTGHQFMTEEVRTWAISNNKIQDPPNKRAWGGITVKARNMGLIKSIGLQPVINPNAHRANATVWVKIL